MLSRPIDFFNLRQFVKNQSIFGLSDILRIIDNIEKDVQKLPKRNMQIKELKKEREVNTTFVTTHINLAWNIDLDIEKVFDKISFKIVNRNSTPQFKVDITEKVENFIKDIYEDLQDKNLI